MKPHVIKIGGSLLDLPDFAPRVLQWVRSDGGTRPLLVVGGGQAADIVRRFDALHQLGEFAAHWLAVRAMQLNTLMVARVLPGACLVQGPEPCLAPWREGRIPLVDPLAWLEREERERGNCIPHRWTFTSDSIAAHIAVALGAQCLTLLKSTLPPESACTLGEAVAAGIVDQDFLVAARDVPEVEIVNLRAQPMTGCALRRGGPQKPLA